MLLFFLLEADIILGDFQSNFLVQTKSESQFVLPKMWVEFKNFIRVFQYLFYAKGR